VVRSDFKPILNKYFPLFPLRLRTNALWRDHCIEVVEKEYVGEKRIAVKEFEEKKIELRENLIVDLEEKRKLIEAERHSIELTGKFDFELHLESCCWCCFQMSGTRPLGHSPTCIPIIFHNVLAELKCRTGILKVTSFHR
jgi:Sds3-like.